MTEINKDDELLKRLARLDRSAERGKKSAEKTTEDPNANAAFGIRHALYGMSWLGHAISNTVKMGHFVWDKLLKPVYNVFEPVVGWIPRLYMSKVWPNVYKTNEEGEKVISPKRLGIVLTSTFMAAAMVLPMVNAVAEAGLMATTMRTQTVYLHTVNPHNDGTYSIKGCDNLVQCQPGDSSYYNVESSIAKHIWSLFNHGSLYVPRRMVGTVAPDGNNRCEITVYGAYYEKFMQNFDIYPELLDITCTRVNNEGQPIGPSVTPGQVNPATVQQQAPAP